MRKIKKNKLEKNQLTQAVIKNLFDYHQDGHLVWKIQAAKNVKPSQIAGSLLSTGYKRITIDGKDYKAHRLIYLWHHGILPAMLDHIDNNRQNNRIENLRPCTREQNQANIGFRPSIKRPHKNVYRLPNGRYRTTINRKRCNYKQDFEYELMAVQAATLIRNLLDGEFANHGKTHEACSKH
jgi:hypothetical protein